MNNEKKQIKKGSEGFKIAKESNIDKNGGKNQWKGRKVCK